jgi:uncharacterized SAM-binding protein YcdF (DUF218 family)
MKKIVILAVIAVFIILITAGIWKHEVIVSSIWNYLVVSDEPKKADVIIVISGGPGRVQYGAQLFRSGYADKIFLSGASQLMVRQAVSLGVPEDHILVENRARTTYGNAKYSSEIMESQGYKSAILVTSPYHTRRAGMIFHQFFQKWDLTVCSIPYDASIATNWWKDKNLIYDVTTEYLKMVYYFLFQRYGL